MTHVVITDWNGKHVGNTDSGNKMGSSQRKLKHVGTIMSRARSMGSIEHEMPGME